MGEGMTLHLTSCEKVEGEYQHVVYAIGTPCSPQQAAHYDRLLERSFRETQEALDKPLYQQSLPRWPNQAQISRWTRLRARFRLWCRRTFGHAED